MTYGVDRLVKTDEGEDATDVVLHQVCRDALVVDEVEQLQGHVGKGSALVGIGDGGGPFHRREISEHVALRREDAEERLPFASLLL